MLIGVFCTVDSRFSAVTTISFSSLLRRRDLRPHRPGQRHPESESRAPLSESISLCISPPLVCLSINIPAFRTQLLEFAFCFTGTQPLWQRIQFISHHPTVRPRAIALQIVMSPVGPCRRPVTTAIDEQVIGIQAQRSDLRVGRRCEVLTAPTIAAAT